MATLGKYSDEDWLWLVRYRNYMSELEKGFSLPVVEWGVDEWQAVAKVEIFEKIRQKPRPEAYRKHIKEIIKLYKTYRSGGTGKKGKVYEPKNSIRKICKEIRSTKFGNVLEALMDAELCNDWYESTSDPIGVLFTGVDESTVVISYLPRGALPDEQKQMKFRTLRNILSKINK